MASQLVKGNYLMLIYRYSADILARRDPFRAGHLEHWNSYLTQGLVGAGPTLNPVDTGFYLFQIENRDLIEEAVANDPYMKAGLVTSYEIREWMVSIGS